MATVFSCTGLVLLEVESLYWGILTLAFGIVCMTMNEAVVSDGICRRFWERVTGEPIE